MAGKQANCIGWEKEDGRWKMVYGKWKMQMRYMNSMTSDGSWKMVYGK